MSPSGATRLDSLPKQKAEFIDPMDSARVSKLPDGLDWTFEIKLDGYRAIAAKADGRVNLFSRRLKSFDHHCPLIVEALAELPEGTVVDGEVVALDETGRPNFNLLQNFRSEASRIHYFIFDLLVCQDRDLTRLQLSERRRLLKKLVTPVTRRDAQITLTFAVVEFLEWTEGAIDFGIRSSWRCAMTKTRDRWLRRRRLGMTFPTPSNPPNSAETRP